MSIISLNPPYNLVMWRKLRLRERSLLSRDWNQLLPAVPLAWGTVSCLPELLLRPRGCAEGQIHSFYLGEVSAGLPQGLRGGNEAQDQLPSSLGLARSPSLGSACLGRLRFKWIHLEFFHLWEFIFPESVLSSTPGQPNHACRVLRALWT